MYLLLAFIIIPLLEIAMFIQVGGLIGLWPTLALVLITAFAGTALLRAQGFAVLQRARASLARNEMPVTEVFDGFCLVVAGVLLLTPGFVTDTLGLLLFVPPVRAALRRLIFQRMSRQAEMRIFVDGVEVPGGKRRPPPPPGVIEGDFREVDAESPAIDTDADGPPADSRWRPSADHPPKR
jgi:UPF0716 protein FxsA